MVSNRKNIFITLLLLILAGAGIKLAPEFKKLGIFGQAEEKVVDSSDAQTNTTQNLKLGTFLKSPGALFVPPQQDPLAVATSLSPACHEIAIKVHSLDLRDEIPVNLFPTNMMFENCMDDIASLQKLKQDFKNSCLKLSGPTLATEHDDSPNSLRNECHSALFMLRAVFTKIAVGNTDLKNINDPKILMELMFAEFAATGPNQPPNVKQIIAAGERFHELRPDVPGALKVIAGTKIIEGLFSKDDGKQSAQSFADAERYMNQYDQQLKNQGSPPDPGLDDSRIAIATHGFEPKRCLDVAAQMIEKNPNDSKAFYLQSYGKWKMGDKAQAIADLKRAIQYASSDPNSENQSALQATLQAITAADATDASFRGLFRVGINSTDFQ